jgi:hypothetical protein
MLTRRGSAMAVGPAVEEAVMQGGSSERGVGIIGSGP